MSKQVCVIGAGTSGISSLKSCIEEGLKPVCYESNDDWGGVWNYKKHEKGNRPRVYKSLVTNISKESACFSDFPCPKDFPPYISHTQQQKYLKSYVRHFNLEKYITFDTEVENVEEQTISAGRLRWKVTVRNVKTSLRQVRQFDSIIVCTGLFSKANMPHYKGLLDGTFKGKVMHSCGYDTPEEYEDKRVLVIGLGNSAADIAVEVSRTSNKTILSSRSGAWIFTRVFKEGLPMEMTVATRFSSLAKQFFPRFMADWFATKLLTSSFTLGPVGLRSKFPPSDKRSVFVLNDELPAKVMSGKITIKHEVLKFDCSSVYFTDGTKEDIDTVICATGYSLRFPFLNERILADLLFEMKLFEWIFPFELLDPSSIAIVGLIAFSGGAILTAIECQSRYVAKIISETRKLPSREDMKTAFEEDKSVLVGHGESCAFKRELGFSYPDGLASLGGFYPGFWQLLFRDPKLTFAVHFGPVMNYHYRLIGKHTWAGARSRIMNCIPNTLSSINPDYLSLTNE